MKLNLNKFYIVYNPWSRAKLSDVFTGRVSDIDFLYRISYGDFLKDQIQGIYTTEEVAALVAQKIWDKSPFNYRRLKDKKKEPYVKPQKKTRFKEFIYGLEALSSTYGIAIQKIVGVLIFDEPTPITYTPDQSSGSLSPQWEEEEKKEDTSQQIKEATFNIKKFYIVFFPKQPVKQADIFSGQPYNLEDLISMFLGEVKPEYIEGLYTTKAEARQAANKVYKKFNLK